jgi:serine/threonine-protein kinase
VSARPPSDASYGQTAVGLGYLMDAQVQECVVIQAKMREMGIDEPLGEILVKKRYLTSLQHQTVLKKLGLHTNPIPGYTLLGRIGQGGMGTVYKATQTSVNRVVAVKVLAPQAVRDPAFVERFFNEARAAGRLSHRNLIAAIDAGEAGGLTYFVMEFVTGKSCRELLNREGPFPPGRAIDVGLQMADVLGCIHEHKLVHRDIKPENILLTPEGVVKLCDLGLAKSTAGAEQSLTQTGMAVGTPYFMSPEQCRGDRDVDIRADLYSLGATLYFLTTGRHPFEGRSSLDTMNLHLTAPLPDPRRLVPELSEDFVRVIHRLMAKDRADRYQTPADLRADLERLKAGEAPAQARLHAARSHVLQKAHVPTPRPVRLRGGRGPLAAILAGVPLVAVVLILAWPRRPEPPPPAPRPVLTKLPDNIVNIPQLPPALARAREASARDPSNVAALVPLYETAVEETRGGAHFEDARRVLDGLYRRELEPLEEQVRSAVGREDFGQALAILETARRRHAGAGWAALLDPRPAEVRARAAALFAPLRDQAAELRRRGGDPRPAVERVARWALPEFRLELDKALAAAEPAPAPSPVPAPPPPPAPPSAGPSPFEAAARLAAGRDYAGAAAILEMAGDPDLEVFRSAQALLAETLAALAKTPKGQRLAIRHWDEEGAPQALDEAVVRADVHRLEFRRDDRPLVVELGELLPDSVAELWRTRTAKKGPKDPRAAAALCLLEGDLEGARRQGGPELPERFAAFARRRAEERPGRRDADARRAYYAADRDFADPATAADAALRFAALLKDAESDFVRRNRAAIAARAEGGREYFLFADDLRGSGAFRLTTHAKVPSCWTSDAEGRGDHAVEIAFSVHPGLEYRLWVYAGACCMETFTFQAQAADGPDPPAAAPQAVKQAVITATRTHQSHGGAKQPSRWGWVPVPLPRYAAAGTKRVRLLTEQKGFSVGYAFVSALKAAPPKEAELKELERGRADAPIVRGAPADPALVGWWRLDERAGLVASDSSRHRNHGALRNGGTWEAGRVGGALALDGMDDHVRVPDSPSLASLSGQLTMAAWVKRGADQEAHRLVVSRQLGTGDENQFWLGFRDNQSGASVTTTQGTRNAIGREAPVGEWLHLAATYDGSTLRLYVNGSEAASEAHGGALAPCTRGVAIGGDEFDDLGSIQEVPRGLLDEVRLYSRVLTPAELAALATGRAK